MTFYRRPPAEGPPPRTDFLWISAFFVRRSGIPGKFLYVPVLCVSLRRLKCGSRWNPTTCCGFGAGGGTGGADKAGCGQLLSETGTGAAPARKTSERGAFCMCGDFEEAASDRKMLYVVQWCFRAGHCVSGQDFGRSLVGKASKLALRPAFGRSEGRFSSFAD